MPTDLATIRSRFGAWDYGILAITLGCSLSIGLFQAYKARRGKDPTDFLMANKQAGLLPLTMSSVATYLSAVTLMGLPSEVYASGVQYFLAWAASIIGYTAAAYIYMPIFHNLHLTSCMEYLEIRFNRWIRILGSALTVMGLLLYTAFVIYLPALAINQVTGVHLWTVTASLGVVCISYTALGGLRAVIWTDVFQVVIMLVSVVLLLVYGTMDVGGMSKAWAINAETDRTRWFRFTSDANSRYTFWSLLIGEGVNTISDIALYYVMVQRQLATPTVQQARKCILLSFAGNFLIVIPCILLGLVVYAKYSTCDPKAAGIITSWDQLTPLFSVEVLGFLPGLAGVYMGGILCATLSTMSSTINTLSLIILEDFITPWKSDLTDVNAVKISKVLAFVIGGLTLVLVLVAEQLGTIIQAMYMTNAVTHTVLIGVFTLGILVPWSTTKGVTIGTIAGASIVLLILIGIMVTGYHQPVLPVRTDNCVDMYNVSVPQVLPESRRDVFPLFTVSPPWFSCIGASTIILVGMVASILTGPGKPLQAGVINPTIERYCRQLPKKWRDRFGYIESNNHNDTADMQLQPATNDLSSTK